MAYADSNGKSHAEDDETVVHKGLDLFDVDGLNVAAIELLSRARESLEDVRENEHGCCGPEVHSR
ncbi:hypothetical protein [Thermomonas aquatica]|uniref:Uncharacterized protein n=1 Tax=Thermomonas aquatica TaxID=2202149 RepID=A0A5B7ZMB5_9GAMM|nr:hypothetical protein [Thermomonas aquatica]QDA56027.1 hypothetical protein FHQ07_01175 [Thermomonas aquatica]